jgi:hypothetical protein
MIGKTEILKLEIIKGKFVFSFFSRISIFGLSTKFSLKIHEKVNKQKLHNKSAQRHTRFPFYNITNKLLNFPFLFFEKIFAKKEICF